MPIKYIEYAYQGTGVSLGLSLAPKTEPTELDWLQVYDMTH